ncbi:DnaJ domain-containing protein [Haematococcus lacustris]
MHTRCRPFSAQSVQPNRLRCRSSAQSHYDVLGVPRTSSLATIKAAYRRLAIRLHPDVNKEPGAQAQFVRVNHAWETLGDADKKAQYDNTLAWERQLQEVMNPSPKATHQRGDSSSRARSNSTTKNSGASGGGGSSSRRDDEEVEFFSEAMFMGGNNQSARQYWASWTQVQNTAARDIDAEEEGDGWVSFLLHSRTAAQG